MSAFAAIPVRRGQMAAHGHRGGGTGPALAFGAVMAVRPSAAVALLALAVFLAPVVVDLPLAVGLLVFLAFVNQVPFFDQVQDALVAMVAVVAIRAFIDVRGPGVMALRRSDGCSSRSAPSCSGCCCRWRGRSRPIARSRTSARGSRRRR